MIVEDRWIHFDHRSFGVEATTLSRRPSGDVLDRMILADDDVWLHVWSEADGLGRSELVTVEELRR